MKVLQKWCVLFLSLLCLTVLAACQGPGDPLPAPDGNIVDAAAMEARSPKRELDATASSSAESDGSEQEPSASPSGESGEAAAISAPAAGSAEHPEAAPPECGEKNCDQPAVLPACNNENCAQPEMLGPVSVSSAAQAPEAEPAAEPEPEPVKNTTLYVLMFHSFVPEGTECNTWTLTETRFRENLQWLADNGYTTILPSELAAGEPLPEKAVMLTFDDGYLNNYTIAYPILQEFQAKAVLSLVVNQQFLQDPDHVSWEMCKEMVQSGLVEIGSHTYNCHENALHGIQRTEGESREEYEARVFTDIQTSIDLIEKNVGTPVQFFAYPNGKREEWANDFLKERFAITVTTMHGGTDISKGLYNMNRCNVSMNTSLSSLLPTD